MKIISFFNHKGGVAKTTNIFHLGWKLAAEGKRVVLVDADSQCNLTGLAMGILPRDVVSDEDGEDSNETNDQELLELSNQFDLKQKEAEEFWDSVSQSNIHSALSPVFLSKPEMLVGVDCQKVKGNENLFLLPGSLNFANYESDLSLAQSLRGQFGSQRNLPGAIYFLLQETAKKMNADYLLIDLSPSLGAINQNIVCISDEVVIPCYPDYFSYLALESLSRVLPEWYTWAKEAASAKELKQATYPFPEPDFKIAGLIMSRWTLYKGRPARAFEIWMEKLATVFENIVRKELIKCNPNLVHSDSEYKNLDLNYPYIIAEIREFNSLRPRSQEFSVPVFELTQDHLKLFGKSWTQAQKNISQIDSAYSDFASHIKSLVK